MLDELWYRRPAATWMEALPVGNGRLGAMVFGGTSTERLALNLDTLWSGGPRNIEVEDGPGTLAELRHAVLVRGDRAAAGDLSKRLQGPNSESYQPLGDLVMEYHVPAEGDYRRALDLRRALATVQTAAYTSTVFCSAPDGVLVVLLRAGTSGPLDLTVTLHHPHREGWSTAGNETIRCGGRVPAHVSPPHAERRDPVVYREGEGMRFVIAVRAVSDDGTVRTEGDRLTVHGATSLMLLLSARDTFQGWNRVPGDDLGPLLADIGSELDAAVALGPTELLRRHVEDHRTLYDRVRLDLGSGAEENALPTDVRLERLRAGHDDRGLAELLFDYGRYLLIASSRPGSQPANLQGIWCESVQPSWSSNLTSNINVQMNYWAAETTNLPECHVPLVTFVEEVARSGTYTARHLYDCSGWTAHHNIDLWRCTWPVGEGDGDPMYAMWPMGGAWLVRHLVDHARFGGDDRFLIERVWPILRGAAEFALDFLVTDGRGRLVTCPSTSPENTFYDPAGRHVSIDVMCTMDIWLLRDLLATTVRLARRVADAAELGRLAGRALQLLPEPLIGSDGRLVEWSHPFVEFEPGHRHFSHLYGLYPGDAVDVDATPDLAAAARRSLEGRLAADGGSTGWSRAWAVGLWARLRRGDEAVASVRQLLARYTAPNMFDIHPPDIFQIDGTFGATAGIAEMLMQGHGDRIRLLPALPAAWPTGSVRGLRAPGPVLVDLQWSDGRLRQATLTAVHDRVVDLVRPPGVVGPSVARLRAAVPETLVFEAG